MSVTKTEWDEIRKLGMAAQTAHTKAKLAMLALEDAYNELRVKHDVPGNVFLTQSQDGALAWVTQDGKPMHKSAKMKTNGKRVVV